MDRYVHLGSFIVIGVHDPNHGLRISVSRDIAVLSIIGLPHTVRYFVSQLNALRKKDMPFWNMSHSNCEIPIERAPKNARLSQEASRDLSGMV